MKQIPPHDCPERRRFFRKAALCGVAALAAMVRPRSKKAVASEPPAASADGRYRLTAHVRKYYQRASL